MQENEKTRTLPAGETALFCAQISLILKSGIPLYDGISTLCESGEDAKARKVFEQITHTVEKTASLYEAVKEAGVFPSYMVNMVRIGEKVGKLDDVMESLYQYYEREAKTKKSIKNAILYPTVLILMMAVVIAILVVQVMPIFTQVFQNLGAEMSAAGTMVMQFGLMAGRIALVLIALIVAVLLVLFIVSRTKSGSVKLERFSGWFPLTKKLSRKISSARFASVLAMMLSSGYHLEEALELAPGIVSDPATRDKIRECQELMDKGVSFPEALVRIKMFSGVYNKMIRVGFQAGQLDTVMNKLTDIYEEEVDDSISRLVSIIEPTMVAILSVVIGVILLSVMLPLAGIMSSIG
ncbi:type II secretion system F family protein [Candidatus Soleaferrea massiliensis]|uniref:type II secretion system F family protein n=1 Tax=Candidatus Soleaferrea massiliensis TaxID=1470354 RepID=UPI0006931EA7|nr:type II secretion system F family protein [Candidatus Soleaferrea massiliensis]